MTSDKLTPLEQSAIDAIDMDGLLHTLYQLVSVPSVDGTAAENEVQDEVAHILRNLGFEIDRWTFDYSSLQKHPAFSAEVERTEGIGVVGSWGQGDGPSLILNGHVDVVAAGDEKNWSVNPWQTTIQDGKVYGRGALDMKGGLCCGIFAAKAIMDAGISLNGKLIIQSVIGEEDGGSGMLATILRGHVADAAIIMEPTEMAIAPAQAGALNFRVTVPGLAAHGATRYEGVSAIEKFIPLYNAIMQLEAERNASFNNPLFTDYEIAYPICVGTLNAGIWASTVAEECQFEGRYGIAVGEDINSAKAQFERVVAETAAADEWMSKHSPVVEWWGGQFESAGISADEPILNTIESSFQTITGKDATQKGMPYGADMRLLVNNGNVPTLMFGPGDVRKAHQPDEYVPLADLEQVTKVLCLTIMRFCGVA